MPVSTASARARAGGSAASSALPTDVECGYSRLPQVAGELHGPGRVDPRGDDGIGAIGYDQAGGQPGRVCDRPQDRHGQADQRRLYLGRVAELGQRHAQPVPAGQPGPGIGHETPGDQRLQQGDRAALGHRDLLGELGQRHAARTGCGQ
jgi:hypothetical protein